MSRRLAWMLCLIAVCAAVSAVVLPRTLFAQAKLCGEPVGICPAAVSGTVEQLPCPIVVIGQPKSVRITEYPPIDNGYGKPKYPALKVVATLTQPSRVAALVQLVNQAVWGPFNENTFCAAPGGYFYRLRFGYANGDRWTVGVEAFDCQRVFAHGVVALASRDLVRYLDSLGGVPPR